MSEAMRARWEDSGYRERLSASLSARFQEPEMKEKMSQRFKGRRHSPETIEKMRVSQLARCAKRREDKVRERLGEGSGVPQTKAEAAP